MVREGTKVLLIEDDISDARAIRELLSIFDGGQFELKHVSRVREAEALVGKEQVHIALLDLTLPDATGLDALDRLQIFAPQLPVIVVASELDRRLAIRAVDAGAQDYLVKDQLDAETLFRCIRYAIARADSLAELRTSEERYALAVRGARDGIWDWTPDTGEVYYSPRWKEMLGYSEDDVEPRIEEWLDRIHPDDRERVSLELHAHADGKTPAVEAEYRMQCKDGSYRWMICRGLAVHGSQRRAIRIAGSQGDVTERKAAEQQVQYWALHDELTELPNRSLFVDRLEQALRRSQRAQGAPTVVLSLGLDRFKAVNESYGHGAGDRMLETVAERLQQCLRLEDTLARVGGDLFMILLESVENPQEALMVAERLQENVARPFEYEGRKIYVTASIGVTTSSYGQEVPGNLMRDAEIAMHRAKNSGPRRFQVFDSAMHDLAVHRIELEADIRRGIEQEEFCTHFQPIVNLRSGEVAGFEALLRWEHPERGVLAPAEFIALAEGTGQLIPIFQTVLPQTVEQLARWQRDLPKHPPVFVNINLSRTQLAWSDLLADFDQALSEVTLLPETLGVEVTESVVMENLATARELLVKLKARSVRLHMDDFGTGYSSLGALHDLPFDALKIDRSFVAGLGDADRNAIVRAIVTLAHTLGLTVTAEGIEEREQLDEATRLACEYGQGFLLGRPAPAEEATLLLTRQVSREDVHH